MCQTAPPTCPALSAAEKIIWRLGRGVIKVVSSMADKSWARTRLDGLDRQCCPGGGGRKRGARWGQSSGQKRVEGAKRKMRAEDTTHCVFQVCVSAS